MAVAKKEKKKATPGARRKKIAVRPRRTVVRTAVKPASRFGFAWIPIIKYIGVGFFFVFALTIVITSGVFQNVASPGGQLAYESNKTPSAKAVYQYTATGGQLVIGSEVAASLANVRSWRGTAGNDGRYWSTTRDGTYGLDKQLFFDGVAQQNANKMIITMEDKNVSGTAYVHQICDWVSSTYISSDADANCTGGGWRTLNERNANHTSSSDTTRTYEIYDGYFWWESGGSPGTKADTPISNFIKNDSSKRVLIRVFSLVGAATQHDLDEARIELAIDPVYQPSGFTKINSFAGATSNYVSYTIGTLASDGNKFTITNNATNPMDVYFSFTGLRTYDGANTIVVKPEICVSTTALTFDVWIYNFTTSSWEQLSTSTITGTACTTDTAYAFAKNNVTLTDYISSGEARIRFNTAVANTNTFQLDRLYMMVGSTNTDTALCEISMGTGTVADCSNTRTVADVETGSGANTSTWQTTSELEYPNNRWALDDDNATDGEAGFSSNLSFPVTVSSGMAVTAFHWAGRYRSNATTLQVMLGARDYSAGWSVQLGTTNALTTYTWTDSWQSAEFQTNPERVIDTVNNRAALRLRTSLSTTTSAGTVRDWDFALVSIRWVEEANRVTLRSKFAPTGGQLVTGSEIAVSLTNQGSWRGAVAGTDRYWSTQRANPGGLDKQIFFDDVVQQGANKMIISIDDKNVTTGNALNHQICDWVSSTLVDTAADANCTGGGWRTLNMRKVDYTHTIDTVKTYEIYDGYFWDRTTTPGTKVDTPIANFIKTDSTKRVLIRVYSTVASTVQHDLDEMKIELAIDPVYESSGFTKINSFAGATSNFVSDTIGTGASDTQKFVITNTAANPLDVYFSFAGVRTYTGANTIVVKPEVCVSNTALTFNAWIYNFTTPGWEQLNASTVTLDATCTTDRNYAFAKNNVTLSNYISSGEVRVRFNTATANTETFQIDRFYIMVGSTNTDTSLCEISMGTGTAADCANTRTVDDVQDTVSTANTSTWQTTSELEYPNNRWALDDDNGTDGEAGFSSNLSFPITVSSDMAVTAIHFAGRYRSNISTVTVMWSVKDYGSVGNTSGGWLSYGGANNSTNYGWLDSYQSAEIQDNPDWYIDTVGNKATVRLRTSVSTATSAGTVRDWDFAMMSIRWVENRFQQSSYRFFANVDSTDVGSALAAQNVAATAPAQGTPFRLRMLMHVAKEQLSSSGENFKLQVAERSGTCDTTFSGETYADISPSSGVIRFYGAASPSDGVALTPNANDPTHSGHTIVPQTYEKQNNFTNSQGAIPEGQDGKWDFVLVDNSATSLTAYCFRMVKSNGQPLDGYTVIPQITTANSGVAVTGTIYTDEGSNAMTTTPTVRVKVNGAGSYSAAAAANGTYSVTVTSASAGDVVTVYLDGATEDAVLVTRYNSGSLTSMMLYQNRVIVRHEDAGPITNTNLNQFDNACNSGTGDTDILFCVDGGNLTLSDGAKLLVWTGDTFTPGGTITTSPSADGTDSNVDGDVEIQSSGILSMGVNALSIGGDFTNGGTFSESGSPHVATFTATATGHSIDNGTGNLDSVTFNGSGGGWSFVDASNTIADDVTMTAGTLSGTNGMTVNGGDITGDGTINFTGGTVLLDTAGNFGGATAWTLSSLTFGDGSDATTTTATGSGGVTVSGVLTIAANQILDAGSKIWTLSGTTGAPFSVAGTFTRNTSTIAYTGNYGSGNTTLANVTYHHLTINNGSESYVLPADTTATGDLTITAGTLDVTQNNYGLTIGGSFDNNGTVSTWNGTVTMNAGSTGKTFECGGASFHDLVFNNASGGWTVQTDNCTVLHDLTLTAASSWTLQSGRTLEVRNTFTNNIPSTTTWTGSTLYLNSGTSYTIGSKTQAAETYGTLQIGSDTHIRLWNSTAASITTP